MKKFHKTLLGLSLVTLMLLPVQANEQHSHPQGQSGHNMEMMKKMKEHHQQMMEKMKQHDQMMQKELQVLDKLKGEAKLNKMAEILKKIIQHQIKMREHMQNMHQHMVGMKQQHDMKHQH